MEKLSQRVIAAALVLCGFPTPPVQAHPRPTASSVGFVLRPQGQKADSSAQEELAPSNPPLKSVGELPKNNAIPADLVPRPELFPLWLELSGVGLGVASVITGGVVRLATESPPPASPKPSQERKKPYFDGRSQGLAMILAGAQLALVSLIFLAIDRWPRRSYTAPRLGKRFRFQGARLRF